MKGSIAALNFILSSAAKYSVGGDTLANELQQLGLPKGKRWSQRAYARWTHVHPFVSIRPPVTVTAIRLN